MTTQSLFHYTRLSTFLEYILPSLAIRFNQIQKTNDPYENELSISNIVNPPGLTGNEHDLQQRFEYIQTSLRSKKIVQDFKILCFSQSHIGKRNVIYGYNMPRMWSQYGDDHKGICIEFDKEKLIKKIRDSFNPVYFRNVQYRNKSNLFDLDDKDGTSDNHIKSFLIKNRKDLFFTKHNDWSGEREFRILYVGQDDYVVYLKDCIKAIYLGLRFNHKYYPLIKHYNQKYKIRIYQIYISGLNLYRGKYIEQV